MAAAAAVSAVELEEELSAIVEDVIRFIQTYGSRPSPRLSRLLAL